MSNFLVPSLEVTVGDLLTQQKLDLYTVGNRPRQTSYSGWPEIPHGGVLVWQDFTWQHFQDGFGHLPSQLVNCVPTPPISAALRNAADTGGLMQRNAAMLAATVPFLRPSLNFNADADFQQLYRSAENGRPARLPGHSATAVDHVTAMAHGHEDCLVVGLVKPWWNATAVCTMAASGNPIPREVTATLRQLANACRKVNTRYGYIQTATHLVAGRFNLVQPAVKQTPPDMGVELMPVPWANHGHEVLTTDLALLWLHALAASGPENRCLVGLDSMVSITHWDTIMYNDWGGVVQRHRHSRIERAAGPQMPAFFGLAGGHFNAPGM